METMSELSEYVSEKAKQYLRENGTVIENYPTSIVDFVIEYASNRCRFPKNYTEKQIVSDLERCKNTIAAACNDIYSKAGAEGQTSHSENGVSRNYDSAWITVDLFFYLPNYGKIF